MRKYDTKLGEAQVSRLGDEGYLVRVPSGWEKPGLTFRLKNGVFHDVHDPSRGKKAALIAAEMVWSEIMGRVIFDNI